MDLNAEHKTIKLWGKDRGHNLCNLGFGYLKNTTHKHTLIYFKGVGSTFFSSSSQLLPFPTEMMKSHGKCPSSTPRDLIHLVQDSGCACAFRKAPRWFQCAARLRTTWWNEELPGNTFSIVISQGRSLINLSLSLTGEFVRNACSQATLQPCWTRNSHPCFNKPSLQGILMPRSSWRTSASVDKFWHRQEQLAPNKKIHVVKKQ